MTKTEESGVSSKASKNDPRFVRPKKQQTKLKVDARFKDMFESEEFQAPVKVDKYGRKVVDRSAGQDLKRFYQLEEEADKAEESQVDKEEENEAESESESSSSSDDDSSSSGGSEYDEPEMLVLEETLAQHPLVNQSVEVGEASRRIAVVNLDWDQIKALDILHMVQAFKPATGVIESVKIYPSEFGRERLAKEAIEGPPKDIFKTEEGGEDDKPEVKPVMVDEGEDFDEQQLRKYQLDRLKYFYAVISCDSVETAASIYRHCDGAEFEMSANFLDLRYIPDEVTFSDDEPYDVADSTSKTYHPKTDLITPALQHSKVKLTWDMDDPDRARLTKAAHFDYAENDLKAYLASSEEESEDEEHVDAEQYRKLLLSGGGNVFGRKSHEDNEDLQITFTSGFGENVASDCSDSGVDSDVHMEATFPAEDEENTKEGSAKKPDETVFEARIRRMREKKAAKKEARLAHIESLKQAEKAARDAERKNKGKKRATPDDPEDARKAAELDLLMLEDQPDAMAGRHFDLSDLKKGKKGRKGRKEKTEDEFKVDVTDDRFAAIYAEPSFSIDPTHPAYKPTPAMRSLIDERQRRTKSSSRHQ